VQNEAEMVAVFTKLEEQWGKIDFVVHAIAFANREDLKQPFSQTSREGFQLALDVSAYSLVSLTRCALPVLNEGSSIVAMTYLGSVRSVPAYNVMGVAKAALESSVRYLAAELGEKNIRVNAVSAGPIKTLAASGIGGFKEKLRIAEERAPLKRLVTQDDVGKSALYLLSDLASGVTGEIHYVDGGFSTAAG
jgi:enoyl-[acyl-carrier protein] reductase I